jgi:Asp-tRNA(Asn)/Glu-tRNA(Gln) amidotransferase A subunit family amidase
LTDLEDQVDHGENINPLSGLTVGVKDIIDVEGLVTRNGSEACRDAKTANEDAQVVARLRAAGAEIIGKTTTTEFAFTDPTNCRNPYDIARTPGGSSSGSGAAVAAGLVDLALGTQTAGSLCRPAAYCGVVGFKPSYGVLPTHGVSPLARSFDTVGIIAATVAIAEKSFRAMAPPRVLTDIPKTADLVATASLFQTKTSPSPEAFDAWQRASRNLVQLGLVSKDMPLTVDAESIVAHHRTVMNFEAAIAHRNLASGDLFELLKPKFRAGLVAGMAISPSQAADATSALLQAKSDFWAGISDIDIILTMAVPDGAPLIDGTTGFQDWLTPWTVFGGPLITLPWGLDSLGRPLSVMLAAHPGHDATLLGVAAALESVAPTLPAPTLPSPV